MPALAQGVQKMSAYLISNNSGDAQSRLLAQLQALSGTAGNAGTSVAQDVQNGINFQVSLAEMLKNSADGTDAHQKELRLKKLDDACYNQGRLSMEELQIQQHEAGLSALSPQESSLPEEQRDRRQVLPDYSVLEQRPDPRAWEALKPQAPKEEEFSLLGAIGDGLLKAAKIATAVAAFV